MTTAQDIDWPAVLAERLTTSHPDVLRELLATFVHTLMGAEADALCGAGYGQRSAERTNQRNGYRHRQFDTRTGTLDLAIPKLRHDSYFPDWLLERRKRAERALTTVVATCYLLGVSTRRMDKLVETLGITGLSKSQVSVMAKELDTAVEAFRTRPLDAGPYTFMAADALVLKVREQGRVVNVHALIAVGVNAEGYREILGVDVTTAEDGAGWLTFLRSLTARGLSGVKLVTSDAHAGLINAIGATLPGASWQRCRTHYATNLMAVTPRSSWPWVRTLLHSVFDQPDAESVGLNMIGSSTRSPTSSRRSPPTSTMPAPSFWRSPPSPNRSGARSGQTTPRNGSTRKSVGAPMSSVSSPTAQHSSASSERYSPNNTTNGSNHAATSASTSSANPEPTRAHQQNRRPPRRH
jgi:putative transposase